MIWEELYQFKIHITQNIQVDINDINKCTLAGKSDIVTKCFLLKN